MNTYEQKQERRRARLETAAERADARADAGYSKARRIMDMIPMGQPVLVGHHSEGRHRADLKRIDQGMRTSVQEGKRADELRAKAAAVGTGGISSDDPDAVAKLRAELEQCEANQARMKAANAALRKAKTAEDRAAALAALGFSPAKISALLTPDFMGRTGFADFETSNNAANIRRIKARIAQLEARPTGEAVEKEAPGGVIVRENTDDNRLQLVFPGKPDDATRAALKSHGFRWSPTAGAWQRQLTNAARYAAECVLKSVGP